MKLPVLEELRGFLVIPQDAYERLGQDTNINTQQILRWAGQWDLFHANTEREALDKARELYLAVGTRFYLIPLDIKLEVLEPFPYQFQERVVAVAMDEEN